MKPAWLAFPADEHGPGFVAFVARGGNDLCASMLERAGLRGRGWWTEEGPGVRARKAIIGSRDGSRLTPGQRIVLRVAWASWLFPHTHASAPVTARELMALDADTAANVYAFLAAWAAANVAAIRIAQREQMLRGGAR